LRVAARVPGAVGAKTTEAEQLAEADRLVPQLVAETMKSVAFGPETVTPAMVRAVSSLLVSVADCWALLPKVRLTGLTTVGTPPRPVTAMVWGLPLSESLKFITADRVPAAVGANTKLTVQLAPAASDGPHVLL